MENNLKLRAYREYFKYYKTSKSNGILRGSKKPLISQNEAYIIMKVG